MKSGSAKVKAHLQQMLAYPSDYSHRSWHRTYGGSGNWPADSKEDDKACAVRISRLITTQSHLHPQRKSIARIQARWHGCIGQWATEQWKNAGAHALCYEIRECKSDSTLPACASLPLDYSHRSWHRTYGGSGNWPADSKEDEQPHLSLPSFRRRKKRPRGPH